MAEYRVAISFTTGDNRTVGGGFTGYEWAVVANLIPESVGRTLYIRYQ